MGVLALLFNAIGLFDFIMYYTPDGAYLTNSDMTQEQVAYNDTMPGWFILLWSVCVFGAFIASIVLLARRRVAFHLFAAALAGFVMNNVHTNVLSDGGKVMGGQLAATSGVIAVLFALFAVYARKMGQRGVLR